MGGTDFKWGVAGTTGPPLATTLASSRGLLFCAYFVVSAHISLQVKQQTQVCEGEKQSQLLSATSLLWFWRRIRLVAHLRDEFLSFLCCGTSWFERSFSSQCQREPASFFNKYFCISSGILAD